jgi:GNAT superfamily N-acetyltransferase
MEQVKLLHVPDGQIVVAVLRLATAGDLQAIDAEWKHELEAAEEPNSHWSWSGQSALALLSETFENYVVVCHGQVQGAMGLNLNRYAATVSEQFRYVYIRLLATAPWNRAWLRQPPRFRGVGNEAALVGQAVARFRGVGAALVGQAVVRSFEEGYEGRTTAHVLPQAEAFYTRLGFASRGPDPEFENLTYMELTPDAAMIFVSAIIGNAFWPV